LGCVGLREEPWWIGIFVGVELGLWVAEIEEWIAKRVEPPFGLIALARGWPTGRNVPKQEKLTQIWMKFKGCFCNQEGYKNVSEDG